MKKFSVLYLIPLLIFLSCSSDKKQDNKDILEEGTAVVINYAKGFTIEVYDKYKIISLRNPADTSKILKRYILVDKSIDLPADLPEGILIRTPLERVVAYSTIHCTTLKEIGKLASVKGVCEPQYINIDFIKNGVKDGTIADLGSATSPMIEKVVEINPETILIAPIEGQSYGNIERLGIPMIETLDYLEGTPLGQAEWIRFYSFFYNNQSEVDSLFANTVNNYLLIKNKVSQVKNRPSVFLDLLYQGVWYTPGGDSYISKMLHDAGADYVWGQDGKSVSTPLPFEQVLDKAGDAQFWLIKYNMPTDLTYSKLEKEYKPYSYFSAFKNRHIYECNAAYRTYYEDLPIHPEYILQDFAYIFHPEFFPGYQLKYYYGMKE